MEESSQTSKSATGYGKEFTDKYVCHSPRKITFSHVCHRQMKRVHRQVNHRPRKRVHRQVSHRPRKRVHVYNINFVMLVRPVMGMYFK